MFHRLIAWLGRRSAGQRLRDAEATVRAARAAYTNARVRGDKRGQHDTYQVLVAAKNAQLRAELGR